MQRILRGEKSGDQDSIRDVLVRAFPTDQEARLVDRLRHSGRLLTSLVIEIEGAIVGHIAFSPVTIESGEKKIIGAGLAPVAVPPDWQNRGIGAQLIRAGLSACETACIGFVVVLGEPDYYRRFGFRKASLWGIGNTYGVDEPFMSLAIRHGALQPGIALFAPEFAGVAP
jgi:putative acetyltransferase